MPLAIGCSKEVVRKNTKTLIHEGYPPKVAYAIANDLARKHSKMCPVNKPARKPKKSAKKKMPPRGPKGRFKKRRKSSILDLF